MSELTCIKRIESNDILVQEQKDCMKRLIKSLYKCNQQYALSEIFVSNDVIVNIICPSKTDTVKKMVYIVKVYNAKVIIICIKQSGCVEKVITIYDSSFDLCDQNTHNLCKIATICEQITWLFIETYGDNDIYSLKRLRRCVADTKNYIKFQKITEMLYEEIENIIVEEEVQNDIVIFIKSCSLNFLKDTYAEIIIYIFDFIPIAKKVVDFVD